MGKQATFGNAVLANKMVALFGEVQESVKAEMTYSSDVEAFIRKVRGAHQEAANSKLVFG